MKKNRKVLLLLSLTILLSLLTYYFCYFIAEKYFFDKFFYQKSVAHGYYLSNQDIPYINFGDRAKDLIALENNQLIVDIKNYNIVIIGDSHVWGQGVRNKQRFAEILENKLNNIRPTKIYSLGKPGFSILDYYNIFNKSRNLFFANLYIVIPVSNDALIEKNEQNSLLEEKCQKLHPNVKLLDLNNYQTNTTNNLALFTELINLSWKNQINTCVVDLSIKSFPTESTIFLIDKNYNRENFEFKVYQELIHKNGKYQISTEVGKFMDKYKKYFTNNVYRNFEVSQMDPHPNSIANQMYADILFDEITTNPQWNFLIDEK